MYRRRGAPLDTPYLEHLHVREVASPVQRLLHKASTPKHMRLAVSIVRPGHIRAGTVRHRWHRVHTVLQIYPRNDANKVKDLHSYVGRRQVISPKPCSSFRASLCVFPQNNCRPVIGTEKKAFLKIWSACCSDVPAMILRNSSAAFALSTGPLKTGISQMPGHSQNSRYSVSTL